MRILFKEYKARDLVNKSDSVSKDKSKSIRSRFEKVIDTEVYFSVDSQTTHGKQHIVILQIPNLPDDVLIQDIKEALKKEDIKVACSCEAFLYNGFKYLTYNAKSGIDREGRSPNKRNPLRKGMLCKHILAVLKYLGVNS